MNDVITNIETLSVVKIINKKIRRTANEPIFSDLIIFNLSLNKNIEKINKGNIFAKNPPNFFSSLKNINVTNTEIVHHGIIKSKKIRVLRKIKLKL